MELLINGLTRGAIYALVALGYTMVYGILGMINFAHGEIFMIGMFACVFAIGSVTALFGDLFPLNLLLGLFFAILLSSAFGYSNERIAYRKLRHSHILAPLTSAIGLSIVLQNFIMLSVSKDKTIFPRYYSDPLMLNVLKIGPITMTYLQAAILGTTLILMIGLFLFIQKTKLGIALRATSQDNLMANLVGIPVNRIIAFTFILGSSLAGVAGVMVSMYLGSMQFNSGYLIGLKAFTAAILGGIGNIPGAVLGGILIGLAEDFTSRYLGSDWKNITTFLILMAILILRPHGLLGERVANKV